MNSLFKTVAVTTALILLTLAPNFSFAQRVPIARSEPNQTATVKVDAENIKANDQQPNFDWAGQTIEVRIVGNDVGMRPSRFQRRAARDQQPLLSMAAAKVLSALGARPAASVEAIRNESRDRGELRGNNEVNQGSMPDQGTILVAKYILEVSVVKSREEKDLNIFLKRFRPLGGITFDFNHGSTTAYTMVAAELKERSTLTTVASFCVRGKATHQDNLGASILSGIFRSSGAGFQQNNVDMGVLDQNSMRHAFEQLMGVMQLHDTSVRRPGNN